MSMATLEFSIGGEHGWRGILLGLAGCAVFMLSGWQDLKPKFGVGSGFWFFLALFSAGGIIWLGLSSKMWGGALLGSAVFCTEAWLIYRWWRLGGRGAEKSETNHD